MIKYECDMCGKIFEYNPWIINEYTLPKENVNGLGLVAPIDIHLCADCATEIAEKIADTLEKMLDK